MMKREREVDSITMANYLMLLSRGGATSSTYLNPSNYISNNRVFECKTCNRQFTSFQALGGHRASHKKPRFMGGEGDTNSDGQLLHGSISKPKTHECSVCGLEFSIGQALGGHMRRHRTAAASASNGNMQTCITTTTTTTTTTSGGSVDNTNTSSTNRKNKGNSKKVLFLDLNLTPSENDLEFLKIGQPTPLVDCFN